MVLHNDMEEDAIDASNKSRQPQYYLKQEENTVTYNPHSQ